MFREGEQLATHTTLQVGGPAERFIRVHTEAELLEAVTVANEHGWPFRILGGGSNVLASDSGVTGLVIHNCITGITVHEESDNVLLTAGAGEDFDTLVAQTVTDGWWGLENLSHIPGSVGATPVQNVGAYGVEVKDVIASVRALDTDTLEFVSLTTAECQFTYRDSVFKHAAGKRYIVVSVTFRLTKTPVRHLQYKDLRNIFGDSEPTQIDIREAIITIRSKKFPNWKEVGTAGSFFKNPVITQEQYQQLTEQFPELPGFVTEDGNVKVPLGWILDKVLQLKGMQTGNVGTYEGQALVLVNHGGATATEIQMFADTIVANVKQKLGITVEWEVTKW